MANPTLDALAQQVTANTSAEASAVVVLNGIAARIQTAVDAALAGGASAADLAPVTAEIANLQTSAATLSAAIAANTPAQKPAKKP
jgi:hypothetical protein